MAPSTFRQIVAEVASRAKERLPEAVNGRVESAVKLVLGHDVVWLEDGAIEVGSSSDPLKSYRLEGTSCTCQDFVHGQAPAGWCQHRIAAGIAKRVQELLPVEPPMEPWPDNDPGPLPELKPAPQSAPVLTEPAPAPLPEAPASVNVHLTISGRQVQLILRDTDETRLLARLQTVLAQYPLPQPQAPAPPLTPQQHNAPAQHKAITGVCPIHQVAMQLNTKEGRSWYSHRLPEGGWCKGK